MKGFAILAVYCLVLLGCSSERSLVPIQKTEETDNFRLILEVNKGEFQEDEGILINSSFEYTGEKEIRFDQQPAFVIVVWNEESGEIARMIEFNVVEKTMTKGEAYSKEINDIHLAKGKYGIVVQASSAFSVGVRSYVINTTPFLVEIK
ncbi:hypothetical protein [Cohnella cellulosilytica]|uniref:Intracellular proteinase inhibitor BsuPI domain-containing protein n=1 Tax=Cohnella cellulosilytica TaxID=986710 RepID=A0ABW2FEE1_9BACL